MKIKSLPVGRYQAICQLEPRGKAGLEGYQAGQIYQCEFRTVGATDGRPYFRLWPNAQDDYYECCSVAQFERFFGIKMSR